MARALATSAPLTAPRTPAHYRGPDIPSRRRDSMRRRTFLATMGTAAAAMAGTPLLGRAAEKGPIRIGYFGPLTGDISQRKPVRWIVRTSASGSQLTHSLGDYAYKQLKLRRVATISMDYAFGWESNAGFQRVFEDAGGKVVQRIWTPLSTQDYAPYLTSLKKDVDGVYACHTGGLSPRFVKAWSDFGLKGKISLVGVGTLTDENILKGMGDEALGVITSLIYSSALDNPANKTFAASYARRYNRTTSLYSAEGYTAGRFYYEALKAVNGDAEDKEKFLAALRKVEITDDARGPLKMDALGNPIQNVYIRTVERVDGQLQNSVIHTYPNVSQFWTYGKGEYLKAPPYDRNYPPCTFCE